MRRYVVVSLVLVVLSAPLGAQRLTVDNAPEEGGVHARIAEGTGTVQYDPGSPADSFPIAVGVGNFFDYFGNRFDTRNGAPLSPGTITQFSWYAGNPGTLVPSTQIAVFAPVTGSVSATVFVFGVAPLAFNSAPVTLSFSGSKFGGILARSYGAGGVFGSVGARSASTNSQGFHGLQKDFYGMTTSLLPGQNIMFRVSGSLIVPVELQEFDID